MSRPSLLVLSIYGRAVAVLLASSSLDSVLALASKGGKNKKRPAPPPRHALNIERCPLGTASGGRRRCSRVHKQRYGRVEVNSAYYLRMKNKPNALIRNKAEARYSHRRVSFASPARNVGMASSAQPDRSFLVFSTELLFTKTRLIKKFWAVPPPATVYAR